MPEAAHSMQSPLMYRLDHNMSGFSAGYLTLVIFLPLMLMLPLVLHLSITSCCRFIDVNKLSLKVYYQEFNRPTRWSSRLIVEFSKTVMK